MPARPFEKGGGAMDGFVLCVGTEDCHVLPVLCLVVHLPLPSFCNKLLAKVQALCYIYPCKIP